MRFGSLELHIARGGNLLLDGGAMFGVVPKVLWQKKFPADGLHVQEAELAHARAPHESDRASYDPSNWEP